MFLIVLAVILACFRQDVSWGLSFLCGELTAFTNLLFTRRTLRLEEKYRGAGAQLIRYGLLAGVFYFMFRQGQPFIGAFLAGFCLIQFGLGIYALTLMARSGKV